MILEATLVVFSNMFDVIMYILEICAHHDCAVHAHAIRTYVPERLNVRMRIFERGEISSGARAPVCKRATGAGHADRVYI